MPEPQHNSNAVVLMALGELKGQMGSIQSFLTNQTERMDRQDERMDRQDERMNEQSRKAADHTAADLIAHDEIGKKIEAAVGKGSDEHKKCNERINKLELKIAYWSGGAAVLAAVTSVIAKKMGLG